MATFTLVSTFTDWIDWTSSRVESKLLFVKESTGMPWWLVIISSTLATRLVIFPLRLRAWRNGEYLKMSTRHVNTTISPVIRRSIASKAFESVKARDSEFRDQVMRRFKEVCVGLGVSPWKSLTPLPFSVPIFLGLAGALRRVDYGGSGLGIWRDFGEREVLTAIPCAVLNFMFIEYSRRKRIPPSGASNNDKPDKVVDVLKKNLPFIMGHGINICSLLILTQVPSAINLYVLTSTTVALSETLFMDKSGWLKRQVEESFKRDMLKIEAKA